MPIATTMWFPKYLIPRLPAVLCCPHPFDVVPFCRIHCRCGFINLYFCQSQPIHMYVSTEDTQHTSALKHANPFEALIKTKHRRSNLKNGRMQSESNRIGTCSPARCVHANIAFLSKARSSCRVILGWWHVINAAALLDRDACVFVTTKWQMQIAFAI